MATNPAIGIGPWPIGTAAARSTPPVSPERREIAAQQLLAHLFGSPSHAPGAGVSTPPSAGSTSSDEYAPNLGRFVDILA